MKGKMRILVVDDEAPVAMMIVSLLTRAGFAVTAAHDGDKAIELASETKFDLITLDVDLPGRDGFDLCRELKQRHISRQTPVVFVSGSASTENRQWAFELGAADFITKPFQPEEFLARIFSQLEETATP